MFWTRHKYVFKIQSVACALLVLNLHWIAGCGQATFAPPTAGAFQIQLTDSHPLSQALRGSAFQGATMMEIFPQGQAFRLVFPDRERQVSGAFAYQDGEFVITQFTFKQGVHSATITFDEGRRVATITTAEGQSWTRAVDGQAARYSSIVPNQGVNAYVDANIDLITLATEIDENGGLAATTNSSGGSNGSTTGGNTSTGSSGGASGFGYKAGSSEPIPSVAFLLALVAAIWAPLAGLLGPLVTIFTVASVLEGTLVLRFDGNWRANNGSSNMQVTISNGKITRLIDESSQQELEILSTRLTTVSGNRVVWTVLASVLGQATEVEFTFDVQELADGTLDGTLTALGSSFARVPVKMTRM